MKPSQAQFNPEQVKPSLVESINVSTLYDSGHSSRTANFMNRMWNYCKRQYQDIEPIKTHNLRLHHNHVLHYRTQIPNLLRENLLHREKLRTEGIIVTDLHHLYPDLTRADSPSNLLRAAELALPILQAYPVQYDRHTVLLPEAEVLNQLELYTWGLQKSLLNLIENYIELPIAYHGMYFRRDFNNGLEIKSRQWHIDMEDYRIIKVIIYLNDIQETSGPFQYLSSEDTERVKQKLNYTYGYLKTSIVETVIPTDRWKSCLGPAGTVVIVDTARLLHRGKLPETSDRYTLFYDYTSRRPKHPFYCKSSLSVEALSQLTHRLTPEDLSYVLWRS